jgi:hypothetical protein
LERLSKELYFDLRLRRRIWSCKELAEKCSKQRQQQIQIPQGQGGASLAGEGSEEKNRLQ